MVAVISYIKLLQELDHIKDGLINIQNIDDNESFKQCLVRFFTLANIFQENKFSKILQSKSENIYENKEKYPICVSENTLSLCQKNFQKF